MKVLVIGGGGREHALAWKLKQSPRVTEVLVAPGNAGTGALGRNISISATDIPALLECAQREKVGLTVVGPDDALAAGLSDVFQETGLRVFGAKKAAAKLEWSKIFAKEFMVRHGIPCAQSGHFSDSVSARKFCAGLQHPVVVKADGLALGKGVIIAETSDQSDAAIIGMMDQGQFGDAGKSILIEEFLTGPECSLQVMVDGSSYLLFPSVQDHKTIFDGNKGPNTGGMGTFSPSPRITPELENVIHETILRPFIAGVRKDGLEFNGLLFPGLMLTPDGPKVLEFNCRFGDPETQALMVRLQSDLLDLMEACIDGKLSEFEIAWDSRAAVCVVMASAGYPASSQKGVPIRGIAEAGQVPDTVVFHAGTQLFEGSPVTAGGRVLGVTSLGSDLESARKRAYAAVDLIQFDGAQFRSDIGLL